MVSGAMTRYKFYVHLDFTDTNAAAALSLSLSLSLPLRKELGTLILFNM